MQVGGCDTASLAKEFGTPLYVMCEATLREKCREYNQAFNKRYPDSLIIYASKALSNTAVLKIMDEEGVGVDVSSGGEFYTARLAGCKLQTIYFHGNNKSRQELKETLEAGIGRTIVDNLTELKRVDEIAGKLKKRADILFRVNPGIEAHTHEFIQTGQIDSKFGIQKTEVINAVKAALALKHVNFVGLHAHIGSQILDLTGFESEIEILCGLAKQLLDETGTQMLELNMGGGLGISYLGDERVPAIDEFAERVVAKLKEQVKKLGLSEPRLVLEPGRSLVGNAGITLYSVGAAKDIPGIRKYVMIDGGMSDNPRPILYDARYAAYLASREAAGPTEKVTLAGRFCESGDKLIKDIDLPHLEENDLLAVACTGAYTYSMASNYNRVPRPAMVLVNNGQAYEILRRETYEDLTRMDVVIG